MRILHRGGVDRDLVRAGIQEAPHVFDFAHAAAHGEGDEHLRRHRFDDMQDQVAFVRTRGDIEEGEFVRALIIVAVRDLHRIAGIAQPDEIHALHDAAVGDVQTGNDAFG